MRSADIRVLAVERGHQGRNQVHAVQHGHQLLEADEQFSELEQ